MREIVIKLQTFLKKNGYLLSLENNHWVLENCGSRVCYEHIGDIMGIVWNLYSEELGNLDFTTLSDPVKFEKKFPGVRNPNEVREQLLEDYLDCASFYMLSSTDERLLQFCATEHYQLSFDTSNGLREAWGFYGPYMEALDNCTCVENGSDAIRYRINWFAGISEPGKKWEEWFEDHQTITYRDNNGMMHSSEIWAPRIGNRSICPDRYLKELEASGNVEINISDFYDNYRDGMKFYNCKMLIRKF